ncbi:MAG: IS110 family transposase [Methanotrichaceae archaeon]|nr:IS110 family transposase [Methanotrichaceae archaeon]
MNDCTTYPTRIDPGDYDLFVGMDVDKRSAAVTLSNDAGQMKSLKMGYDPQATISYVRQRFPGRRAIFAYEAGPTGFGLHDALVEAGYKCLVAAPAMVPTQRGKQVKTNKLDSIKLSTSLKAGQITGIRVPSHIYRELRELVGLRDQLVRHISATKHRIKSMLLAESLAFPAAPPSGQWSKRVVRELRELACSPAVRFKLDTYLEQLKADYGQAAQVKTATQTMIDTDPELSESVRLLMSMPGVGWVIASAVVARVGDPRLLGRSEEMASFLGLVPRESSTGDHDGRGHITKGGDAHLRAQLVQGAWTAIRIDEELGEFYRRVLGSHSRRGGAGVAIVAVARKMAIRMSCLLKERREYQPARKLKA